MTISITLALSWYHAISSFVLVHLDMEANLHQIVVEIEQEEDGRWIAEVTELPGVMVYGLTRLEAVRNAKALALRVIADKIEHGETSTDFDEFLFAVPA